jgi:hypothetical protein
MKRQFLRVSIENLGPIASGEVEIRPLSVFIGPNNSGKTFLAQAIYALGKSFQKQPSWAPYRLNDGTRNELSGSLYRLLADATERSCEIKIADLPHPIAAEVTADYRSMQTDLASDIDKSLSTYLAVEHPGKLVRTGARKPLVLQVNERLLKIVAEPPGRAEITSDIAIPDTACVNREELNSQQIAGMTPRQVDWCTFLARKSWSRMLELNALPNQGLFYLPAYRSGLLQVFDTVARSSLLLLSAPWAPQLATTFSSAAQGILFDFVSQLPTWNDNLSENAPVEVMPAIELLENQLIDGKFVPGDIRIGESIFMYHQGRHSYPIWNASSMAAELAALDVLLRGRIRPGDLLIVDEPEAHLHPQNQRLIARVIVRLIRAGVRVICATHSSLFIQQLSNQLLVSLADEETRRRLDYSAVDILKEEELAVYLFQPRAGGSKIKPVPIVPGFGISEQEFLRVAEAIGEESYQITRTLAPANS